MVEVEFYLNVPAQAHVCFLAFPPKYCIIIYSFV